MVLVKILYDKKEVIEAERFAHGLGVHVVIYVKDEIIMGEYKDGTWKGEESNGIYFLIFELLKSIAFLLSKGDKKYLIENDNKELILTTIKEYNFNVRNIDLAIYCDLGGMYTKYIFELDDEKDELIIHYKDEIIINDRIAYKAKNVKVPFKPFIKDIFNIYLDEFLEMHKMFWSVESYQMFIDLINDIKRLYKERYGEELEFEIPE